MGGLLSLGSRDRHPASLVGAGHRLDGQKEKMCEPLAHRRERPAAVLGCALLAALFGIQGLQSVGCPEHPLLRRSCASPAPHSGERGPRWACAPVHAAGTAVGARGGAALSRCGTRMHRHLPSASMHRTDNGLLAVTTVASAAAVRHASSDLYSAAHGSTGRAGAVGFSAWHECRGRRTADRWAPPSSTMSWQPNRVRMLPIIGS